MRYGFAIDQRTCIDCHACTVACKTEHEIPVGHFRTWVNYVDSGEFPNSTRDFGVLRYNHCTDASCVTICPTQALHTRKDGIVDFDNERRIGCKSCTQACPYDAFYLDKNTNTTAAKCAFYRNEISDSHPRWRNSAGARRHGGATGDLVRLATSIGSFIAWVWVTELTVVATGE